VDALGTCPDEVLRRRRSSRFGRGRIERRKNRPSAWTGLPEEGAQLIEAPLDQQIVGSFSRDRLEQRRPCGARIATVHGTDQVEDLQ
jgi:hypothetical protein